MSDMQQVRLRFAPSPTGHLHIGGARTALYNWLVARASGGRFILRLEDTDRQRSRPEYEAEILKDLAWMGLDWDEGPGVGGPHGPYRQTERMDRYDEVVEQLLAGGHAYRCTCSHERLDAIRAEARKTGGKPKYDGHCRDLHLGSDCGPHVVRFRMPLRGETLVSDLIKGDVTFPNQEMDDFIIRRTDGLPTYNFVVVVDDHDMAITHVLRGDDHLSNTPKQVQLYLALGTTPPRFGHMPLILGPDGKRLSKRHGATSVGAYRELGYLPHALVNYLVRLGWGFGDQEIFSLPELLEAFSVEGIGKASGRWNADKLLWVNQHWLMHSPEDTVISHLRPFLAARDLNPPDDKLRAALPTVRARSRTLLEMAEKMAFYFTPDEALEYQPKAVRKFLKPAAGERLAAFLPVLEAISSWQATELEETTRRWLDEQGLKLKAIAQPIRVSITGKPSGPGLYETLEVLGRVSSLARIRRGVALANTEQVAGG